MTHDDFDRALSADEDIVPSSGFVSAVMTAVRAEADAPAPIPFPWTRALIGLGLCAAALVTMAVWMMMRAPASLGPVPAESTSAMVAPLARLIARQETQLIVGSLGLTYLLVEIPRRLLRL